jgi:hypothetical protein
MSGSRGSRCRRRPRRVEREGWPRRVEDEERSPRVEARRACPRERAEYEPWRAEPECGRHLHRQPASGCATHRGRRPRERHESRRHRGFVDRSHTQPHRASHVADGFDRWHIGHHENRAGHRFWHRWHLRPPAPVTRAAGRERQHLGDIALAVMRREVPARYRPGEGDSPLKTNFWIRFPSWTSVT